MAHKRAGSIIYTGDDVMEFDGLLTEEDETDPVLSSTMMNERKVMLHPPVQRWRRLTLKMTAVNSSVAASQVAEVATRRSQKPPVTDDCKHPLFARRHGGNPYGKYVHCVLCKERISFIRNADVKNKSEKKESKPPYEASQNKDSASSSSAQSKAAPKPRGRPPTTLPATPGLQQAQLDATLLERQVVQAKVADVESRHAAFEAAAAAQLAAAATGHVADRAIVAADVQQRISNTAAAADH